MAGILIDTEKCIGCGTCAEACPAGALSLGSDGLAAVNPELCAGCGVCVSSCPCEAIAVQTAAAVLGGDVAVFAERENGVFLPVVFELLGKGRELADALGGKLCAVAFGSGALSPEEEAALLGSYGADKYLLQPGDRFAEKNETVYRDAFTAVLREQKPAVVLVGATLFGRGMAPGAAALLGTGLTADCTSLEIDRETGHLIQTRPAFGGNLMASIVCAERRPQMATVRPGVMQKRQSGRPAAETELLPRNDTPADGYEVLSRELSAARSGIADARIILDCGRGVGSKKNLRLVRELASRIGAAVGCSRPLVDTGMCEYSSQIGQTGTSVAPDLLILLGISGAVQHLAGIGGAKKIIAVNTDPDAPVFAAADVKIVADCMDLVKEMLAKTQKDPA